MSDGCGPAWLSRFMTGVKQTYSRDYKIAIDTLTIGCQVRENLTNCRVLDCTVVQPLVAHILFGVIAGIIPASRGIVPLESSPFVARVPFADYLAVPSCALATCLSR